MVLRRLSQGLFVYSLVNKASLQIISLWSEQCSVCLMDEGWVSPSHVPNLSAGHSNGDSKGQPDKDPAQIERKTPSFYRMYQ